MRHINIERGQLWVDALFSRKYRQAHGAFIERDDDGRLRHCCLAVATDVAIRNGCTEVRWGENADGEPRPLVPFECDVHDPADVVVTDDNGDQWVVYSEGDMPPEVADWFGIMEDGNGNPRNPVLMGTPAINRNDSYKNSFATIADAIKEEMTQQEATERKAANNND